MKKTETVNETTESISQKVKIYIAANFGGGVRKSTTIAYLYYTLIAMKKDPLIIALDTNSTLRDLLPNDCELITWDINNEDQSHQNLGLIIKTAHKLQRPIIIDIAAMGGDSLGIHTLIDTGMFEICDLIAVTPVLASNKSIVEACNALNALSPEKWILVQYDTNKNQQIYDREIAYNALLELNPRAIVKPPELTGGCISNLRESEIQIDKMHAACTEDPMNTANLRVFLKFWSNIKQQMIDAINKTL